MWRQQWRRQGEVCAWVLVSCCGALCIYFCPAPTLICLNAAMKIVLQALPAEHCRNMILQHVLVFLH
jgi:hypothetical protein